MKKILLYLRLVRWVNIILSIFSILIYLMVLDHLDSGLSTYLLVLIVILSLSAGNVINDYFDIETDKINKFSRPLPSGELLKKDALFFYFSLLFIIGFLSIPYKFSILTLIIFNNLLLYYYSKYLKRTVLLGNIAVSYLSSSIFLLFALYLNESKISLFFVLTSFFIQLLREIVKDMEDIKGDSAANLLTFPVKYGIPKSLRIFHFISFIFILSLLLLLNNYQLNLNIKIAFTCLIIIPIILINIVSRSYLLRVNIFNKLSKYLKILMLIGIILIFYSFYDFT